jgi:hypothetical protein
MRKYLVFVSTKHGQAASELYGANRLFDVAVHDYGSWEDAQLSTRTRQSEYWSPFPRREKLESAAAIIPALPSYAQYAFLDDDLIITTDQLNRLFTAGESLGLDLYQPALTRGSYGTHAPLFRGYLGGVVPVRPVPFVEIMCPFFSKAGLDKCLWTFDLNVSGWGLDCYIWPKLAQGHAVDSIPIGHYREPSRRDRVAHNGLTPHQESEILRKLNYDGIKPW